MNWIDEKQSEPKITEGAGISTSGLPVLLGAKW